MGAREWVDGDVALVTGPARLISEPGDSVTKRAIRSHDCWYVAKGRGWRDVELSEVRPLLVIDSEDREQVERLCNAIDKAFNDVRIDGTGPNSTELAQAALRALANPQPPKPDEPTGLGAVVEDSEGSRWIRCWGPGIRMAWIGSRLPDAEDEWATYDSIAAVRVLSEGVA